MKSLNAQLLAFKTSVFDRANPETALALAQTEAGYRAEAAAAKHLTIGDKAPDFTLADSDGERHQLRNYLSHGPVFVLFFKGGWCPYCALTLRAWEALSPEIKRAGASILAISPQKASRAAMVRDSNGLNFPILVDCGNKVAAAFGIVSQTRPVTHDLLAKMGCSLSDENSEQDSALPRPSEFLIDRGGIIRMAHVSPVAFERAEPKEALATLRALTAIELTSA